MDRDRSEIPAGGTSKRAGRPMVRMIASRKTWKTLCICAGFLAMTWSSSGRAAVSSDSLAIGAHTDSSATETETPRPQTSGLDGYRGFHAVNPLLAFAFGFRRGRVWQLLYLIQSAFTIWMLVDCIRRGGGFYWYVIMWMPSGPIVYFFVVKIHDFDLRRLKKFLRLSRPIKVETLRYHLQETPSSANRLALAQGLVEAKQSPAEAADLFREVLHREPGDRRARYGLGVALSQQGDVPGALLLLKPLIEQSPDFHDYDAWTQVTYLRWQAGDREGALEDLQGLARYTQRLSHRLLLGKRLIELGRKDEARQTLELAVEAYKHSPRYIQRREARARRETRGLLKKLRAAGKREPKEARDAVPRAG